MCEETKRTSRANVECKQCIPATDEATGTSVNSPSCVNLDSLSCAKDVNGSSCANGANSDGASCGPADGASCGPAVPSRLAPEWRLPTWQPTRPRSSCALRF